MHMHVYMHTKYGIVVHVYYILLNNTYIYSLYSYTYNIYTHVHICRFGTLSFLAFHRIIRPANRIDPMRTVMELEVISICWVRYNWYCLYSVCGVYMSECGYMCLYTPINVHALSWYSCTYIHSYTVYAYSHIHVLINTYMYSYRTLWTGRPCTSCSTPRSSSYQNPLH